MPSNFPGGLDSFTTKVDGIDDIMADHVNDLQNSVVAIETHLLARLRDDGWKSLPVNPTYVSATSIQFSSVNLTSLFPTGTKIKFTQGGTTKYFYVIDVSFANGNTNLTITAGTDFSVTNTGITDFNFAHGVANGFQEYFSYTPTVTAGTMTISNLITLNAKFSISGKTMFFEVAVRFDTGGTLTNNILISFPFTVHSISYRILYGIETNSSWFPPASVIAQGANTFNVYKLDGSNYVVKTGNTVSVAGLIRISN